MRLHQDDRRCFYADLFGAEQGDINVVLLEPGAICAWHRHQKQTDHLFCVEGTVKVGIVQDPKADVLWETLSPRNPRELAILPGFWHGYMNIGPERAVLVQFNCPKYNPDDEERHELSGMPSWARVAR